jgi:serine protease Do
MKHDWQTDEQIEQYLKGKLSSDEQAKFEEELRTNEDFLNYFLEHKRAIDTLGQIREQELIRKAIQDVHSHTLAQRGKKKVKKLKVISLWRKHTYTISVAASVSILVAIASFLFYQSVSEDIKQEANFKALRKEVDNLRKSQKDIIRNIAPGEAAKKQANYTGTGFAIDKSGVFVTSWHVVSGADSLYIQSSKGASFKVNVVYSDRKLDLAIVKIIDSTFIPYKSIPYGFKTRSANLGERVYTLGFPREDIVYGEGALSSKSGFEGDTSSYQVSIPVNPGNSGGPLIDEKGNVIGIISGKQTQTEGATFAIKSAFIEELIKNIPEEKFCSSIYFNTGGNLAELPRVKQIKSLEDYVVMIKVYKSKG